MKESLLFVVSAIVDVKKLTGVTQKIFSQKKVFEQVYDVYLVGFTPNGIVTIHGDNVNIVNSTNRRQERTKQCVELCKKYDITKCYFRNGTIEPYYIILLRKLKKLGVRILVEIPTYPYDGELKHGIKSRILLLDDKLLRPFIKKYVDRILTYSDDVEIYGVPCINTQNGIDVSKHSIIIPNERHDFELHLIGVALVSDWHGYDRVIEGMKNYNGNIKVYFHIVGDGPAIPRNKALTEKYGLSEYVIFHGFSSGNALNKLYETADVAVATLACHRLGLKTVSSLKVREYAAKGFPCVCAGGSTDAFCEDWPYFINVPADESPIDIANIVSKFDSIKKETNYRSIIRKYAEEHFDMAITLKPALDYFREQS